MRATKWARRAALLFATASLGTSCDTPPDDDIDTTGQATTSCGGLGAACCSSNKCSGELRCSSHVCLPSYRPDYVGTLALGNVSISDGKTTVHPGVQGTFIVRNEDNGCKPSSTKSCRFTVQTIDIALSPYQFEGLNFSGVRIRNARPFVVSVKSTGSIPSGTPFLIGATVRNNNTITSFSDPEAIVSGAKLTISPSGAGTIGVSGTLKKTVSGMTFTTTFDISSHGLANRPPVANAGADLTVSGAACEEPPFFDASRSSDPDNDIVSFDWYDDGVFAGSGDGVNLLLAHRGVNVFTLKVTDSMGGQGIDTVKVTANCPGLPKAR
jgi:hypothetical protein